MPASAYEMDLDILRLYLSNSPKTLGQGGIDPSVDGGDADLYHPARLVHEKKGYISYVISDENVFNSNENDWERISINARETKLTGIIPHTHDGTIKRSSIGFQFSDDTATAHADYTRENFQFNYREPITHRVLACAVQAGEFLALGGGLERYDEHTDDFWEVELRADPIFRIDIRDFTREFNLDFTIAEDDIRGLLPVRYSEDVLEMTMKIKLHSRLSACFVVDAHHVDRKGFRLSSAVTDTLTLTYFRQYGAFRYHQDIYVNGLDSGHNNGDAQYGQWIAGLAFRRDTGTTYHLNVRRLHFDTHSAGLVESDAVLSFWERLLAGKRYFNLDASIDSTQYHLGVEGKWTKRLTVRGGLQYIDMTPQVVLDDWTPIPLILIGKLDEHISSLSYSKITLGVIAAGFTYTIKNLEVTYGIGQYILLSAKERDEDVGGGGGGEGGGEEEEWYKIRWDDIEEAWNTLRENPGGTLQSLEIRWYF